MVNKNDFKKEIWKFYSRNKRELPWRSTHDPYKIYVSEIMLQQTQVSRVIEKYGVFLKAFPTFKDLASADLYRILSVWQGMGYNRRAKFMKETAKIIVNDFSGVLPRDVDALKKLPGIGPATAGSLTAFVYNTPVCFIETNVRRVMIHFFFKHKDNINDKNICVYVEKTLDKENPREWYYALMDYGSMLPKREKVNANVKSRIYTKQSPFKGSDRETRGAIIKILLLHKKATIKDICKWLKKDELLVGKLLNNMEKEKMIEKRGVYYKIQKK